MLINTREAFYSADSEETDERCADSVFLQGSVAASSSPHLSLNLGHFRPPPSGTAQKPQVSRFVSPYSAWPHSQSCAGAGGPSPTGTGGRTAGSGLTLCSGSSMATCVSRERGTESLAVVCIQWSVFCYGSAREQLLPQSLSKKILTSGFILCIWFGFWCENKL